jgi:hypothetical protein
MSRNNRPEHQFLLRRDILYLSSEFTSLQCSRHTRLVLLSTQYDVPLSFPLLLLLFCPADDLSKPSFVETNVDEEAGEAAIPGPNVILLLEGIWSVSPGNTSCAVIV